MLKVKIYNNLNPNRQDTQTNTNIQIKCYR